MISQPPLDNTFHADKGSAADEQDIRGVNPDILLLRMLPAALWRNVARSSFQDF
jgi:hypothetical protein